MKFLFTDLHLHSILSDEDLCDETPEHILTKVQRYVENYNKKTGSNAKCCISITDHNSTLSSQEARALIKTGKFPNVEYINGCEFTTDLSELNDVLGIEKMFTRCHLLAYGYNENDKELTAYSKISHKHFSNEDNIGLQICAARRAVCEKYNISIPFSEFAFMADLKQSENYVDWFIDAVTQYLKKNHISSSRDDVFDCIHEYLIGANTYCTKATSFGRIKLSEAMKMTHDAGGKIVLAHPTTLSVLNEGVKTILLNEGFSESYINSYLKNNKSRTELMKVRNEFVEVILKKFIDASNVIGGNAHIEGLETYNGINFERRKDKPIYNVCHERGLFQTAGSDYHGENFATHKTIGNVLQESVQKEFGLTHSKIQDRELFIRVSELPFIDFIINDKNSTNTISFIDEEFNPVSWQEINRLTESCLAKKIKKIEEAKEREKQEKETENTLPYHTKEIRKRIKNLTDIAEHFSKVLNKSLKFSDRRKKLVKLDSFARSVLKGVKNLQKNIRNHAEYYEVEDVKRLTTLLKEIHRKYYEMLRLDNGIMMDLNSTIKAQGKSRETSIDKLANITIQENGNEKTK